MFAPLDLFVKVMICMYINTLWNLSYYIVSHLLCSLSTWIHQRGYMYSLEMLTVSSKWGGLW